MRLSKSLHVKLLSLLLILIPFRISSKHASYAIDNKIDLIRNYFSWRNINSIIIVLDGETGENDKKTSMNMIRENIFTSVQSVLNFSQKTDKLDNGKYGIALFYNDNNSTNSTDCYERLFKSTFHLENLSWLILTGNQEFLDEFIGISLMGLNVDIVVAFTNNEKGSACGSEGMHNFYLYQMYKLIKSDDNSMIRNCMGSWNRSNATNNFLPFFPTEKRTNFHGFPLKLGKKIANQNQPSENIIEDDSDEEKLIEFANYFKQFLNASEQVFYFQKLGHKEITGEWTDLLKAVVEENVDLGLDRIIKTVERNLDMSFTHEILKSMRNIYVKPQPSNELRDIFLVPFSTKLIICVTSIAFILSILMAIVNKVTGKVKEMQDVHSNEGLIDTIISCIGIFSMQGSCWLPSTYSGNIILITSLAFAELIFNSYSAFITSILSVEMVNIGSLDQLLASSYNIGYVKNGQDEIYLRFMNDTQLQQIYLRGYLDNTVANVTEGLLKSTKGHYAFFASANIARKELQAINSYRCNAEIMEISIPKTKNTIAFPLSKYSPYRKVINLSILKMYETGVYKYLHSMIVPDIQQCMKNRIFRGAQLSDLMTAFAILAFGMVLSVIILWAECLWKNKVRIYNSVNRTVHEKLHFGHHHNEHH